MRTTQEGGWLNKIRKPLRWMEKSHQPRILEQQANGWGQIQLVRNNDQGINRVNPYTTRNCGGTCARLPESGRLKFFGGIRVSEERAANIAVVGRTGNMNTFKPGKKEVEMIGGG